MSCAGQPEAPCLARCPNVLVDLERTMNQSLSLLRRCTVGLLMSIGATGAWVGLASAPAVAVTFTVNRSDDPTPGPTATTCVTAASSDCSLREAVIKANASTACAPPNA